MNQGTIEFDVGWSRGEFQDPFRDVKMDARPVTAPIPAPIRRFASSSQRADSCTCKTRSD